MKHEILTFLMNASSYTWAAIGLIIISAMLLVFNLGMAISFWRANQMHNKLKGGKGE